MRSYTNIYINIRNIILSRKFLITIILITTGISLTSFLLYFYKIINLPRKLNLKKYKNINKSICNSLNKNNNRHNYDIELELITPNKKNVHEFKEREESKKLLLNSLIIQNEAHESKKQNSDRFYQIKKGQNDQKYDKRYEKHDSNISTISKNLDIDLNDQINTISTFSDLDRSIDQSENMQDIKYNNNNDIFDDFSDSEIEKNNEIFEIFFASSSENAIASNGNSINNKNPEKTSLDYNLNLSEGIKPSENLITVNDLLLNRQINDQDLECKNASNSIFTDLTEQREITNPEQSNITQRIKNFEKNIEVNNIDYNKKDTIPYIEDIKLIRPENISDKSKPMQNYTKNIISQFEKNAPQHTINYKNHSFSNNFINRSKKTLNPNLEMLNNYESNYISDFSAFPSIYKKSETFLQKDIESTKTICSESFKVSEQANNQLSKTENIINFNKRYNKRFKKKSRMLPKKNTSGNKKKAL